MAHAGHGAPVAPVNGLPWLNKPVMLHSSRNSTGAWDLTKLTAHEIWMKDNFFRSWFKADWAYGRGTVYLFCAGIGVFTIINLLSKYRFWRASAQKKPPSSFTRPIGFYRYLTSKSFYVGRLNYYTPTLGTLIVTVSLVIFFLTWMLATKPYYWPNPLLGGSPPLATRSGWTAVGMLPFLFAFASKYNLIGMLTGVSHEKLQVFHRWCAWIMYIATLLHTFPFIKLHRDMGDMEALWKGKIWYWTGVAALIPQTWLVVMSWGPIRNRYYETFKKLHYLSAMIFFFFLFIHCNFRLTSWDYLIATGSICLFTLIIRFGGMFFVNGVQHVATFEQLDPRLIKVTIPTTGLQWAPGQHFFVRFLGMGIHAFTSHPFTAASEMQSGQLEFYIRVREGMTSRIATFAQGTKSSRVLLDGPYGTVGGDLAVYERVVLIAGGSGMSYVLAKIRGLLRRRSSIVCQDIQVVWATPQEGSFESFRPIFESALSLVKSLLTINVFVTNQSRSETPESVSEKGGKSRGTLQIHYGRPQLPEMVHYFCAEDASIAFVVCGPNSLAYDVRNAVAECQLAVATGNATQKDIFLHTESFGW